MLDDQAKGRMNHDEPELTDEVVCILKFVAAGWTDERIARELRLSRTTVQRRLHGAALQLGATSRINLVLRAVEAGIIRLPLSDGDPRWPGATHPEDETEAVEE